MVGNAASFSGADSHCWGKADTVHSFIGHSKIIWKIRNLRPCFCRPFYFGAHNSVAKETILAG